MLALILDELFRVFAERLEDPRSGRELSGEIKPFMKLVEWEGSAVVPSLLSPPDTAGSIRAISARLRLRACPALPMAVLEREKKFNDDRVAQPNLSVWVCRQLHTLLSLAGVYPHLVECDGV